MYRADQLIPKAEPPIKVLCLLPSISETSAPYNEYSVAAPMSRKITICSYFDSDSTTVHPRFRAKSGRGTPLGYIKLLRTLLKSEKFDIVHAHSPHVGVMLMIAAAGIGGHLPPTVFTVHNSYPNFRLRNRAMLIAIFSWFQRVVCCSRASLLSFPRFYLRLAGSRACHIANGVDLGRIGGSRSATTERRSDSFTVVSVGRLLEIKNPVGVLDAFGLLESETARLTMIGDGPLREVLLRRAEDLGLRERVTFTGGIPREEVYRHLGAADLYISASRGEGLPVAVLEAMACGCPVLLSDIEPHREVALGTDLIPLVNSESTPELADWIARFESMPPERRAALGQQCREIVVNKFSLRGMHQAYSQLYAQLLGRQELHSR